jgi:hypothetical protein
MQLLVVVVVVLLQMLAAAVGLGTVLQLGHSRPKRIKMPWILQIAIQIQQQQQHIQTN